MTTETRAIPLELLERAIEAISESSGAYRLESLIADLKAVKWAKESRAERIVRETWEQFYGQGLQVAGWHLNGDLEPIDNFFDDNDWTLEPTAREGQKEE